MGVVNVTPDSFSDGGDFLEAGAAVSHGRRLAAEGAARLDVGGESTRPGAEPVGAEEELRRVMPVIEGLAGEARISIDTSKLPVAEAAIDAGAGMVNDVTALRNDPDLAGLCADRGVEVVLMHMLGSPRTMQEDPHYEDVVAEVKAFLAERAEFAIAAGISEERIWLDPGIGFGKDIAAGHNNELLRNLGSIVELGFPVLVGPSRKSFIGAVDGSPESERLGGTIAACLAAARGGAAAVRVHDVAPVVQAIAIHEAIASRPSR